LIRAVVDTNVTVSGLLFGGIPLKVVEAALARKIALENRAEREASRKQKGSILTKFRETPRKIQALASGLWIVVSTTCLD